MSGADVMEESFNEGDRVSTLLSKAQACKQLRPGESFVGKQGRHFGGAGRYSSTDGGRKLTSSVQRADDEARADNCEHKGSNPGEFVFTTPDK
jgi:hypothetical protein